MTLKVLKPHFLQEEEWGFQFRLLTELIEGCPLTAGKDGVV